MTPLAQAPKRAQSPAPLILVVDDELDVIELIEDAFGSELKCRIVTAANLTDARRILQTQQVELLVTDLRLPDGDGSDLLPTLAKHQPLASAMVITGAATMDGAIDAMRHGAVDFLTKPFTVPVLVDRVRKALDRQAMNVKSEGRIDRLRDAVRRLNESRKLVTKKVDLLCNDLVSAYGELSRQLDVVRVTESFRGAITQTKDLEQMLCHAMDWLLRQIGYCNVAIWLAADPGFQLGAYMKYTIAGEEPLVEAMREGLVPIVTRDGFVHFSTDQVNERLSDAELKYLNGQTILGSHCTYLGESLASLILFRDGEKPFTDEDIATLKAIGPIFAVMLASMVRAETGDEEPEDRDQDGGLADDEPDKKKRKRKDDADWWKRGEQPPF